MTLKNVNTYLLEALSFDDISRLHEKRPPYFEANVSTGHGVLVTGDVLNGDFRIARTLPGDNSDVVRGWLEGSAVDLLCKEHAERELSKEERETAVEGWRRAHEEHEEARRRATEAARVRKALLVELEKTRKREDAASRELVRTHGRERIWVNGVPWEVMQKHDRVYYRRCLQSRRVSKR